MGLSLPIVLLEYDVGVQNNTEGVHELRQRVVCMVLVHMSEAYCDYHIVHTPNHRIAQWGYSYISGASNTLPFGSAPVLVDYLC